MIRTCNEDDVIVHFLEDGQEPCGMTYDDVDHSTICPHDPLPPKLSESELEGLLRSLDGTPLYEPVEPCTHPPDRVRLAQQWNDQGEITANVERCRDCGAKLKEI